MVAGTLERWFTAPFRARRRDVVERIGGMIRSTPPAGYIGCCHAIPKINVLSISQRLADAITNIHTGQSVGALFR